MSTQQTFVTGITDIRPSTASVDHLGSIRFVGNKVYKYCVLKSSPSADVDAVAGDMIIYTDYSAHEVGTDYDDIDAANLVAGIATAAIDMSADDGKYLWVQIKGPATLGQALSGGTPTIGESFQGSTTDLVFRASETLKQRCGVVIHVANKEVLMDCPY